ncbi:hypothetical protein E2P71_08010 [Candidatus Bathyarchaeota archaeon]|nr:hypothetical protein E2P71_08010 [Candidatus Bathyarchaeota archaeon]
MSNSGVGFGGFLLGLGAGWYLFRYIDFSFDIISYLLILIGIGMVLNGLLNQGKRKHPLSDIFGGVIGGLFLSIFLTQGFGMISVFTNDFTDYTPGTYRASDTITLNTPVSADQVDLSVNIVNGGIDVFEWSGDNVKFDLEIRAKGSTDSEAQSNLEAFTHDLQSQLSDGVQDISLSFPIPSNKWNVYSVNVVMYVPSDVTVSYDLESTNGGLEMTDITTDVIRLHTTNGAIIFSNVSAQQIDASTTNGGISGTIQAQDTSIQTTNGGIDITVKKMRGSYSLQTTNGGIHVNLPTGTDLGYSVNVDSSIGSVNVNLPNMSYSVDRTRTKIGETTGYSSKPVQIEITAQTTIGSVSLN